MGAEPARQIADPLDRGVPTLTHDIGRPEPAGQGNAVGVTAEHDDLLRTEATGGDDAAGATTRSPCFTVRTSPPMYSTTPMKSLPIRLPISISGIAFYDP